MDDGENTPCEVTRRGVLETGTATAALLLTGLPPAALAAGVSEAQPAPVTVELRSTVSRIV